MENHNDERQSATEPMDHMERTKVDRRKERYYPKVINAGTDMGAQPPTFQTELERLINRHSMENGSDTLDFILADRSDERTAMSEPQLGPFFTDMELRDMEDIVRLITRENSSQIAKWSVQTRLWAEWLAYLTEEVGELSAAMADHSYRGGAPQHVCAEAIQVATLAMKIAEFYR